MKNVREHVCVCVKQISQGRGKKSYYKGQGYRDKELASEHMRINMPAQTGRNENKEIMSEYMNGIRK